MNLLTNVLRVTHASHIRNTESACCIKEMHTCPVGDSGAPVSNTARKVSTYSCWHFPSLKDELTLMGFPTRLRKVCCLSTERYLTKHTQACRTFTSCCLYSTENLKTAPQRSLQAGRAQPQPLLAMYIHSSECGLRLLIRVIRRMNIRPRSAQDSLNMPRDIPQESFTCRRRGRAPTSGHLSSLISFIGLLVAFFFWKFVLYSYKNQPVGYKGCVHISFKPNKLRARNPSSLLILRQCGAVWLRLRASIYVFLLGEAHTNTLSEKVSKHLFLHLLAWW